MAKAKTPQPADPAVLRFRGPAIDGIPDTDLTPDELARLAFVRMDPDARPFVTADVPAEAVEALVAELTASGSYTPEDLTDV